MALESTGGLTVAFWRGSTCGLDRISGGTEFVRGDVCDGPGLASGVRGMPPCPTQVPGRAHCMAARRTSLHHRDLTTHPGAGVLDRFTWSWVIRLSRLEQVKDVLRARRSPQSEEMVIRISEGPTATNRYKPRVPNLGEDHWLSAPLKYQQRGYPSTATTSSGWTKVNQLPNLPGSRPAAGSGLPRRSAMTVSRQPTWFVRIG